MKSTCAFGHVLTMDEPQFQPSVWQHLHLIRAYGQNTVTSNLEVVAWLLSSTRGSRGDAKNLTVLYLGEGLAVELDLAAEPHWGNVESDVVIVEVVELRKLDARNVEQPLVIGRLGDEVAALTVDENDDARHDQQCSVGDAEDLRS